MSTTILLILLFAAVCHAIWNALSKKIEERDAFFTLILGASVILYFPLAVYLWHTLVGGLFVFVSNSLAVYAMQTTPVTYVASVREISIVFATIIGVIWLTEKVGVVKWVSIGMILAGVVIIKLS
ncbi:EamA family transporter [uncultured Brevibacillus sp.]|uniref:EamA family transporter n=1 Tax=uncultured Brevibacillus sp. TaxID=169970 RepID=UPI0025999AA4|nr:EamA family transporter [uncultured Brevibacillus sp.]